MIVFPAKYTRCLDLDTLFMLKNSRDRKYKKLLDILNMTRMFGLLCINYVEKADKFRIYKCELSSLVGLSGISWSSDWVSKV